MNYSKKIRAAVFLLAAALPGHAQGQRQDSVQRFTGNNGAVVTVETLPRRKSGFRTSGTIAGWGWYGADISPDIWLGGRYLSTLGYTRKFSGGRVLEFEMTSNFFGTLGLNPYERKNLSGYIHPYRILGTYTTPRIGITIGMQDISFGPSSLFRPMKWFDRQDARDPLEVSDGVWAALFQYKFRNKACLWVWGMIGNDGLKGREFLSSKHNVPEFGGRAQLPLADKGAIAVTYHFRRSEINYSEENTAPPVYTVFSENKIGMDGQYEWGANFWFEASWTTRSRPIGEQTNQAMVTVGADYTIPVGRGLDLTFEQMIYASDRNAFAFRDPLNASGLSLAYPVGKRDNISAIVYYDWTHTDAYGFIDWEHRFPHNIDLHLMGYWNPKKYLLPNADSVEKRFVGKGLILMGVWNF